MIRILIDKLRVTSTLKSLKIFPSSLQPPREITIRHLSSQVVSQSQSSQSNLAKDIIVYKYDNPRFFKLMNIFAASQFLFWGYLGHWSFTSLRDAKVEEEVVENEELSWWRKINLGENKYKTSLAALCFVVGKLLS